MASTWKEDQRAELSKRRGQAATGIQDVEAKKKFIAAQGDLEEKHGMGKVPDSEYERLSKEADETAATHGENINTGVHGSLSYKHGTDYVPKTGSATLHKGEAVLKKDDADKFRAAKKSAFDGLADQLGGQNEKPPKAIEHIRSRRVMDGKTGKAMWHHEHHHTHPNEHPVEHFFHSDQDSMANHVMEHLGEPNPGEAEADNGQSGIEEGGSNA